MKLRPVSLWNRIKQAYLDSGFAKKWMISYFILIFVPSSLLLYSYYSRSASILEEEVVRSMEQTLRQTAINLEDRLDRYEEISDALFMNPQLHEYLRTDAKDIAEVIDNYANLNKLVWSSQTNPGLQRIRFFMNDSILYSAEQINYFPLDSAKSKGWYSSVLEANGSIFWSGLTLETSIDRGDDYMFSGIRMLRDADVYDQVAGVMVVDVKETVLTDILSKVTLSENQKLYILDKKGNYVYHPDYSMLGKRAEDSSILLDISSTQDEIRKSEQEQEANYYISATIQQSGWKLVAEVPAAEISSRTGKLSQSSAFMTMFIFAVLLLVLMFLLLAMMVRMMNRRIQKMIRMIQKEGVDHYDSWNGASRGDFNLLQRNLNELISKMKMFMERAYLAQVQEREAQLRALQAQINPHFLYNTLDSINWIAIRRGAHDISHMIDSLARYFRLSLNKGRDVVSITDELQLAEVYLSIQQTRFPYSFQYSIEAEPGLNLYRMPKLSLQPIVENALLHGIAKLNETEGMIRIQARCTEGILTLTVTDNGVGMEEKLAAGLLSGPVERPGDQPEKRGSSYGLYNVNERIHLFGGEGYGLSIRSAPGQGTAVTVRLPAVREQT